MSITAESAACPAGRELGVSSGVPKSPAVARPLPKGASSSDSTIGKLNLANSIQALKGLSSKSHFEAPAGLIGEPLTTAYEKRIHTLQDTLKERDQVVQMLTQRLEQAADQLDRVQRTGGGRGGSVAVGLPPEFIENQQSLVVQLSRVLGDWEETQAGQTLSRIESQIMELRELVASGNAVPENRLKTISVPTESAEELVSSPPKVSAGASVFSDIPTAEPAKAGWEAIKAAMLAGECYESMLSKPVAPSPVSGEVEADHESNSDHPQAAETTLPEPPPEVDFDKSDQVVLIDAIRSRDDFIAMLVRRLASRDTHIAFPDWDTLNYVPEDLHRELHGLRDRLQEKLRVAEVDLSLQRAKLAREEAKLAIKADRLARQIRQLGLSSDDLASQTGAVSVPTEAPNANQGRRWLQFLQRSNGHGSGTDGK